MMMIESMVTSVIVTAPVHQPSTSSQGVAICYYILILTYNRWSVVDDIPKIEYSWAVRWQFFTWRLYYSPLQVQTKWTFLPLMLRSGLPRLVRMTSWRWRQVSEFRSLVTRHLIMNQMLQETANSKSQNLDLIINWKKSDYQGTLISDLLVSNQNKFVLLLGKTY